MESMESIKVLRIGTFLNSELGANAGFTFLMRITVSNQLTWLLTIVEVLFIFF